MSTIKRIMLCCGAGMSSGFLASNARKVAKKNKLPYEIEARSHSEVNEYLSYIDLLLLGPHYAAELNQFQELAKPHNVPVAIIPQDIYATLDGKRLLDFAQEQLKEGE